MGMSILRRGCCYKAGRLRFQIQNRQYHNNHNAGTNIKPQHPPKVLIANRGEIACRIIRTCRLRNIPTVAIYSVADGPDALHCQAADEAIPIGHGPSPMESYLLADEILEIAISTGSTLIHPGYGFLSENADFSNAVTGNNIKFVGPSPSAIRAMGNKTQSKRIMEQAGVPITPGFHDNDVQSSDALYQEAVNVVGFPLLIKAVSGGGGKGMRLVWNKEDFHSSLDSCKREAAASFKDDRVLLERYLVNPRHIEVQIVADSHGNTVHLFERDCSMQRRHQKVLEEAPASDLAPQVRERLGIMGVKAGQAVQYENAGTVEFLLDTSTDGADASDNFYFCEMNTRLQVEHPITEMITGVDLVDWQLRVAMGEALPLRQDEIQCNGHAFEARIYAENPANNFLPASGTIWHHSAPRHSMHGTVRLDTGLRAGQNVSVHYDPMISKLIVHGKDRLAALDTLNDALRSYHIAGVHTNLEFLTQCIQHPVVRTAGAINTGFLDDYKVQTESNPPNVAYAAASLLLMLKLEKRDRMETTVRTFKLPWSTGWGSLRMLGGNEIPTRQLETEDGSMTMSCASQPDGSFTISIGEECIRINGKLLDEEGTMEVIVNGTQRIRLAAAVRKEGDVYRLRLWPHNNSNAYLWSVDLLDPLQPRVTVVDGPAVRSGGNGVAPMPGKITRIQAQSGDQIQAGQVIVVLEAMKMEHSCKSPSDGTLKEINCSIGDIVDDGAILFVVDGE
jgi:3-methylcrotonyl-CoA carboxylase alpha subunit